MIYSTSCKCVIALTRSLMQLVYVIAYTKGPKPLMQMGQIYKYYEDNINISSDAFCITEQSICKRHVNG